MQIVSEQISKGRFSSLAALGFNVFPLQARKKVPSMKWERFQTERATSEQLIAWDQSDLNVGVVCGAISNLAVLDIDGPDAEELVASLDLPKTLEVKTARGRHLFFRNPKGTIPNATRIGGAALDMRGEGGYVVGPGSVHPDGTNYDWIISPDDCDIAEMPESVIAAWKTGKGESKSVARRSNAVGLASGGFVEAGTFSAYLNIRLQSLLTQLREAEEGTRNDVLNRCGFKVAADVAALGIDWAEPAAHLRNVALEIGLSPSEVDATLESARKGGERSPTEWIGVAKDWIYIAHRDRFLSRRDGTLLKRDAFTTLFAHVHLPKDLSGELGASPKSLIARFLTSADLIDKALDMVFAPGEQAGLFERDGHPFFNTYIAPNIKPAEGDVGPFLDFLIYLIPNEDERRHLISMIAWTVRNPGRKLGHALLLRSQAQGVGKTSLVNVWRQLLGEKNTRKTNSEEMASNFQSYLAGKLLVVLEEMNLGKGYREYNRLKDLITGEIATINEKFVATYEAPNFANFVFLSNLERPLQIDKEDRRFFVVDTPAELRDDDYWRGLHEWLGDNLGVVLKFLLDFDLSAFNPNARPPMTDAKKALIASSKAPVVQELAAMIEGGGWPFSRDIVTVEEVRAALREDGYRLTRRETVEAMKEAGCIALGQVRAAGHWMWFGNGTPTFIEGQQKPSIWTCRNADLWQDAPSRDRAVEYARLEGFMSDFDDLPALAGIVTTMVGAGASVPELDNVE